MPEHCRVRRKKKTLSSYLRRMMPPPFDDTAPFYAPRKMIVKCGGLWYNKL